MWSRSGSTTYPGRKPWDVHRIDGMAMGHQSVRQVGRCGRRCGPPQTSAHLYWLQTRCYARQVLPRTCLPPPLQGPPPSARTPPPRFSVARHGRVASGQPRRDSSWELRGSVPKNPVAFRQPPLVSRAMAFGSGRQTSRMVVHSSSGRTNPTTHWTGLTSTRTTCREI